MKKIISFFLMLLSYPCVAQDAFPLHNLPYLSVTELFNEVENNPSSGEDILVSLLFSVPVEYHQYVMPMVADMPSISEKTRMMPGIVEWRRKLPTDIAPELTEYAKKHLKYLSAVYYPFLMPEAWPSYEGYHEEEQMQYWPEFLDVSSDERIEQAFPSAIDPDSSLGVLMNIKRKPSDKKTKGAITSQDIKAVMNIISKIKILELGPEGEKRRTALLFDLVDQDVALDAVVNPCQSMVTRFAKIDTDGWLDLQLQKENISKADFVDKCDRIVKAYRLRLSSAAKVKEIIRLAQEALTLPADSFYQRIYLTLLRMHLTNRADVNALDGFDEDLRNTFKTQTMIMSTPVVLDF